MTLKILKESIDLICWLPCTIMLIGGLILFPSRMFICMQNIEMLQSSIQDILLNKESHNLTDL